MENSKSRLRKIKFIFFLQFFISHSRDAAGFFFSAVVGVFPTLFGAFFGAAFFGFPLGLPLPFEADFGVAAAAALEAAAGVRAGVERDGVFLGYFNNNYIAAS